MNLPDLGSVALGITDLRKQATHKLNNEADDPMEITHTYDFNCSCDKCTCGGRIDRALGKKNN
jgi:hypothetical protein